MAAVLVAVFAVIACASITVSNGVSISNVSTRVDSISNTVNHFPFFASGSNFTIIGGGPTGQQNTLNFQIGPTGGSSPPSNWLVVFTGTTVTNPVIVFPPPGGTGGRDTVVYQAATGTLENKTLINPLLIQPIFIQNGGPPTVTCPNVNFNAPRGQVRARPDCTNSGGYIQFSITNPNGSFFQANFTIHFSVPFVQAPSTLIVQPTIAYDPTAAQRLTCSGGFTITATAATFLVLYNFTTPPPTTLTDMFTFIVM
jgi:hypothetical protein